MEYVFETLKIAALTLLLTHDGLRMPRELRSARRFGRDASARRWALVVALLLMVVAPAMYHGLELVHCLAGLT